MIEYNDFVNENTKKIVRLVGQYDTWRQTPEKKLFSDLDWNQYTLPFQYGMRTYQKPEDVDVFHIIIDEKVLIGKSILDYQKNINNTILKNRFVVEHNGLKLLAVNSNFFNSNIFEGFFIPEIHDAMMPFVYAGNGKWKFSLYTTKDVDILSIAKSFGGGGHVKACGFEIDNKELSKLLPNGFQI
jgi:oligoribonuclease NrnB/cAMP/cGMP phosphodiesterase (DHH superfamily)